MLPGMEMLACPNLAVSPRVMQHIVQVESGANPFAIGVVGGRLARQPQNMEEALATARMLESKGYNFSVGIAQVNRANLGRYGLDSYRKAFDTCDNLAAGARILAHCLDRARGDWGKAFSCYYSGNFTTGFRDGYVQKMYASMGRGTNAPRAMTTRAASAPVSPETSQARATTSFPQARMLRPLVVYSSAGADYRVALRSAPVDAAAAPVPLAISAEHGSTGALASDDTDSHGPTAAAAPLPPHLATGHAAALPSARPDGPPGVETASARDVFEPRVRGRADPAVPEAMAGHGTTDPRPEGAGPLLERRDAAFVF